MLRSLFAFGFVVFFFVIGGPRREEVIWEAVRWVPGPGEYFDEESRAWPGRVRVGRDISMLIWEFLVI